VLTFTMPVALPPGGAYDARVAGVHRGVRVDAGAIAVDGVADGDGVEVVFER
jgi:hypothetical protein